MRHLLSLHGRPRRLQIQRFRVFIVSCEPAVLLAHEKHYGHVSSATVTNHPRIDELRRSIELRVQRTSAVVGRSERRTAVWSLEARVGQVVLRRL